MWQLFLERFIPVMEDDPSLLDARDGVGSALPARTLAEASTAPMRGEGSVLPLA